MSQLEVPAVKPSNCYYSEQTLIFSFFNKYHPSVDVYDDWHKQKN